jgi:hypothetical protein
MRNLEDLMLSTICIKLSEITGIPSGRVLAKMPDYEYVNKYDGTNQPQTNPQKFPSIGMQYFGQVKYCINKYGESPLVLQNAFISKIYQPMGEIKVPLAIYLFTNSRREQMEIGQKIMYELASNLHYNIIGDEIPNQYFSVEYTGYKDLPKHRPYEKVFHVELCGQIFKEVSGYLVESFTINLSATQGSQYVTVEPEKISDTIYEDPLFNTDDLFVAAADEDYDLLSVETEDDILLIPLDEDS